MVIVAKVSVKNLKAFNRVSGIVRKLPKNIADGGYEFAKLYERNLKIALETGGHIWRGTSGGLLRTIMARRTSKNRSEVFMPRYGIALDRMKPHFVKLKRGRMIRQWALTKGNDRVKMVAAGEGSIWVRPHPYINAAFSKSFANLRKILKRKLTQSLEAG